MAYGAECRCAKSVLGNFETVSMESGQKRNAAAFSIRSYFRNRIDFNNKETMTQNIITGAMSLASEIQKYLENQDDESSVY